MQIVFTEFFDSSSHRRRSRCGTDLVQLAALSRIPLRCFAGGGLASFVLSSPSQFCAEGTASRFLRIGRVHCRLKKKCAQLESPLTVSCQISPLEILNQLKSVLLFCQEKSRLKFTCRIHMFITVRRLST